MAVEGRGGPIFIFEDVQSMIRKSGEKDLVTLAINAMMNKIR